MIKLVRWTPAQYSEAPAGLRPALDVVETEDAVYVYMNLPGLAPDEVNIAIEGDLLTISGEIKAGADTGRYHTRERRTGAFKRTLRLADTLDANRVTAAFENGVLTLALPKLPESQPRRIEVRTA